VAVVEADVAEVVVAEEVAAVVAVEVTHVPPGVVVAEVTRVPPGAVVVAEVTHAPPGAVVAARLVPPGAAVARLVLQAAAEARPVRQEEAALHHARPAAAETPHVPRAEAAHHAHLAEVRIGPRSSPLAEGVYPEVLRNAHPAEIGRAAHMLRNCPRAIVPVEQIVQAELTAQGPGNRVGPAPNRVGQAPVPASRIGRALALARPEIAQALGMLAISSGSREALRLAAQLALAWRIAPRNCQAEASVIVPA
jgi:hypothetical protein